MSKPKILQPDGNYSFPFYFELPNDTDEVLAEFDYAFTRKRLQLPKTCGIFCLVVDKSMVKL
ncbi:MAG: hypothetical protein ACHBN1_38140 [Heteroscytonema crispum UTEX LB 1556]